jgi:nucleoside-diphosphate-sugar epimerase
MRKKILITGAGGFIASHLIQKINKERNFILYGVDKKKIKKNYRIRFFKLNLRTLNLIA